MGNLLFIDFESKEVPISVNLECDEIQAIHLIKGTRDALIVCKTSEKAQFYMIEIFDEYKELINNIDQLPEDPICFDINLEGKSLLDTKYISGISTLLILVKDQNHLELYSLKLVYEGLQYQNIEFGLLSSIIINDLDWDKSLTAYIVPSSVVYENQNDVKISADVEIFISDQVKLI